TRAVDSNAAPGVLGTGLIIVATALAARPMLGLLGTIVRLPGVRATVGPAGWFAVQNLLSAPRRTALTLATVGVGLGCIVASWTMSVSFQRSLVATLSEAIRPDLVVTSAHVVGGALEAPLEAALISQIKATPGVIAAGGGRTIDWPYGGDRITINSTDPRY